MTVGVVFMVYRLVMLEYRVLKYGCLLLERSAAIRAVTA